MEDQKRPATPFFDALKKPKSWKGGEKVDWLHVWLVAQVLRVKTHRSNESCWCKFSLEQSDCYSHILYIRQVRKISQFPQMYMNIIHSGH